MVVIFLGLDFMRKGKSRLVNNTPICTVRPDFFYNIFTRLATLSLTWACKFLANGLSRALMEITVMMVNESRYF